ncbi:beta-ketoacyl-[acyl-carrier-protein] synthase family protein [Allosalinactinospora lopnorensis]|uniref:hypothetical protein n=1 Tax=Allosalinactinospora lopnorensis TaxID=1352348 RepID=UPI0006969725|nr:hypothetical protein [Allosalinactinospora lopnorensis]
MLSRPGRTVRTAFADVEFMALSSRKRGASPVGLGDPRRFAQDIERLLAVADLGLADLAFMCDFAEGSRHLEDYICDVLNALRESAGDHTDLLLTTQEACFGHIPGVAGLLKILASLVMLNTRMVAPTANLVRPYRRLPASPVILAPRPLRGTSDPIAMAVGSSGGGDTSSILLRLC